MICNASIPVFLPLILRQLHVSKHGKASAELLRLALETPFRLLLLKWFLYRNLQPTGICRCMVPWPISHYLRRRQMMVSLFPQRGGQQSHKLDSYHTDSTADYKCHVAKGGLQYRQTVPLDQMSFYTVLYVQC